MGTMITTKVSKTEGKQRVEVGEYAFYLPQLSEFGITANVKEVKDEAGNVVGYEYETHALNWLQSAVEAAARQTSRNKLVPQTATLRPGAKLPTTLEELVAPAKAVAVLSLWPNVLHCWPLGLILCRRWKAGARTSRSYLYFSLRLRTRC